MTKKWRNMLPNIIVTTILLITTADCFNILHPSCYFNQLCSCSKVSPDLGTVTCVNVPLPRIPIIFNSSRINDLTIENNGLRVLDSYSLYGTGLYTLKIIGNPLYVISDDALIGLEFSLRELVLRDNSLLDVPSKAIRDLQKLRILDLSENDISEINENSWQGVQLTIETLILRENAIIRLPRGVFSNFPELKMLDLSGNMIIEIEIDAFSSGVPRLQHLYLNDNQLKDIPYAQLHNIRSLRTLDLSYNMIVQIESNTLSGHIHTLEHKLTLNVLKLDYNRINILPMTTFRHFESLNKVYLDGNQISIIHLAAFQGSNISELSLVNCGLSKISSDTFRGLERSLQLIDLSNNFLSDLPQDLLINFDLLKVFIVSNNMLKMLTIPETGCHLEKFDISGLETSFVSLHELGRMKELRSLSLSKLKVDHLSITDFEGFSSNLEELSITNGELKSIRSHAFAHVTAIRKLDLSFNTISTIEANSFVEVGHTLEILKLSHALSSMVAAPVELFKHLTNLKFLDLSYNDIEILPEMVFHTLREIRTIHLQDCQIKELHQHTFQAEIHQKLKNILFSYNFIKVIYGHTFDDLKELRRINLEDNQITKIEKRAFINLEKLRHLYLRGNKIAIIEEEAFQNLPQLELLDLAYNNLKNFDFLSLDQVGTMTSFSLNMSYNDLFYLQGRSDYGRRDLVFNANIKVIDLSHNHIMNIAPEYFGPVQSSLTHLYLRGNSLFNVTSDVFGSLHQLHCLDLSFNLLKDIQTYIERISKLQVLRLNNNVLDYLSIGMFEGLTNLQSIDISYNILTSVPDYIFRDDSLEKISFSHNHLTTVPFKAFTAESAAKISELDISFNYISSIHSHDLFSKFERLLILNLSGNHLIRLDSNAFISLSHLIHLDLSHNIHLQFGNRGHIFDGLEPSIQTLCLKNISLQSVPSMHLPSLIHLHLSENNISHIVPELALNLTSLRLLDVSGNNLTSIPIIILSFPKLQTLSLSNNNITVITNVSLLSEAKKIRTLDLSNLPLEVFETGVLSKMVSLFRLYISIYKHVIGFNVPNIIRKNYGLRYLHVTVKDKTILGDEMFNIYPPKLRSITVTGNKLAIILGGIFHGIQSPVFNFALRNTDIKTLSRDVFQNMNSVINFTLDIRGNHLNIMENPFYPNFQNHPFLEKIFLSNNEWTCKCEMGWVEIWERKRRQSMCSEYNNGEQAICYKTDDDLRETYCRNKHRLRLLDVLKTDLECGWSHGMYSSQASIILTIISVLILILNI